MKLPFALFTFAALAVHSQEWATDRPYTLRTLEYLPLLQNLHQQTTGGKLSGIFPRRDSLWRKDLQRNGTYTYKDERSYLNVSLTGGYEVRALKEKHDTTKAIDGGVMISGYRDSVEFWLDARIYNEDHTNRTPVSWDREFLENQNEENGDLRYTSYARYRGKIALHLGWARIDAGRDAVHWGPGYWNNLTFNQQGIPFPQLNVETQVGPLTVKSLYGDLLIYEKSTFFKNRRDRNLYAHRYELHATPNLTIAINEQTVLDSINEPILFVPIVPLFMQKGQMAESYNNGTLSSDFCYRYPGLFRIYSEFLLDDFASPISLVKNDNVESKWAYMGGIHLIHNIGGFELGSITEYSRVEPWVYTHFKSFSAQIAHQNVPLGAPLGPNSQTIDVMTYGKYKDRYTGTLRGRWWWKGTDYGSALNDTTPDKHFSATKTFLKGAERKFTLSPAFAYSGKYIGMQLEVSLFDNPGAYTRLGFQW